MLYGRTKSLRVVMSRCISFKNARTASPVRPPPALDIKLTPIEDQLCGLLDECKRDLEGRGIDVECRIAGGWVRDKLLGSQSNDIDVALSNMMGVPFAEHFVSYASSKGFATKPVSKISRNPEQSKHLETGKTTLLGLELDFVNLRSEEYAEDSRIPTEIRFGTPLEDALRRDITINTLFYHVHNRSVEDHTEKGLHDLRNGIIRTPLAPKETFMDDPLRVIRSIRFASRFDFEMDPELKNAAQDKEIQVAIASKISRERVGEEIDKMMKGRDPLHAIQLIDSLSLQSSLFSVPSTFSPMLSALPISYEASVAAAIILHALISSPSTIGVPPVHSLLISQLTTDKTAIPRLFLAAALSPYRNLKYVEKKKERPAVEAAIREGLKLGVQNHYLDGIPALFSAADLLQGLDLGGFPEPSRRAKIGLLLKDKCVHNANTGSHWTSSLLFSLVQELVPLWDAVNDEFSVDAATERIEKYNHFLQLVEDLNLPSAIDAKPLLDGHEVVSALSAGRPGPWTGHVLAQLTEWQLEHPASSKNECMQWLKDEHSAGRISTEDLTKRGKSNIDGGPAKKVKTSR